jgi:hypothetical protein
VTASAAGPGAAERAGRGPEPRTRRCAYPPTYRSLPIASKLCQDGALPNCFFSLWLWLGFASLRFAGGMNLGQCVWTADWTINDVPLPHDLPAPVCSPHELCRAAAKAIKKHTKHKMGSDQVLLHWPLADGGLFVQGGDNIRLVIKASYRMNAGEVETGVISASSRDGESSSSGGGGGGTSARSSFSGFARRSQSGSPSSAGLGRASLALRDDKRKERREGELRRLGAARNTMRFFTRERCVYIPQQASGMTAALRGGRYVDCHQAGAYLLELESAKSAECGGVGIGGGGKLGTELTPRCLRSSRESQSELSSSGADRALFRITSLTLAFELAELRQELLAAKMEQP